MGMKGHPESNCGSSSGSGGGWMMMKKKKMAMVAVVMLVGLMGVMAVQKVRDRRLFNLLIKDKDRQILSLHLLLQKEKQYAKDTKRKNQDLNAKLYSLRTDKIELNNKLMEMRSTITSMKEEQQALELAIHEKQQEEEIMKRKQSNIQLNLTASSWFGKQPNHPETGNSTQKPTTDEDPKGKIATQIQDLGVGVDHKNNATIEMQNTTTTTKDGGGSQDDFSMKETRYYVGVGGASESQRQRDDKSDKSQVKANWEEAPTEKSKNYSTDEVANRGSGKTTFDQETKTKADSDRMDEDEAVMNASMESNNGSEADQDYKEETDE